MRNLLFILSSLVILGSCASRTQINQATESTHTATPSTGETDVNDSNNNQTKPISFKKKISVRIAGSILTSDKCKFGGGEYLVELKHRPKERKTLATTAVKPELIYKMEAQIPEGQYVLILRNNRKAKVITVKKISVQETNDSLTVDFKACP